MKVKKLISSAMALAISCTSIPATQVLYLGNMTAGAADSSKSFELRTYLDVNGKEVSSTISADDIKAGDVTIPVGLFLKEGENDSWTLSAQWTVKSSDGDASNAYVTFKKHQVGTDYFKSAQSVSLADGTSGSTKSLIGFAGKIVNDEDDGDYFSPSVSGECFAEAKSNAANTPNAFASIAMTGPTSGTYKWSGSKSDEYPVYVVDVVFAKGTPAGTYSLEFCDYSYDADNPDNMSNMIETSAGKMTTKNSKLTLKGLDITVGGNGTPASTTTQGSGQTTTSGEVDEKFIVKPEDAEVNAGETVTVGIYAENGSNRKAGQFVAQVINENLPIKGATATMSKVKCSAVPVASEYKEINGTWYCDTLDSGEPQEIITDKPVARFDITVPANAKSGTYEWKLDRFHVVENGYDAIEFDANLKTGKLTVYGSDEPGGTTTPDVPLNSEVDTKFIVKPEDKEVKAGETVTVGIYAENGSNRKAGQFVAQVINENLPIKGATATMSKVKCSAVPVASEYKEINGTWYCDTLDSGEPQEILTDKPVARFDITVPANAESGTYEWKLDRLHVVENGYDAVEFDAVLKTGKLTVNGGTNTSSEVDEKFIVKPEDKVVNAGDTVTIGIYAENGSNRKAGQFVAQVINENLPIKGATATMSKVKCSAVPVASEYKEINGTWYCDTLDSGEPQEIDTSKPVARFDITVPATAKSGTYEWKLDRFHVVENGYDAVEFDAVLKTGKLTVTGGTEGSSLGDVNQDGKVDAKDASLILMEYSKNSTDGKGDFTARQKKDGDVNFDGKIDAKDASTILQFYSYTSTGGTDTIEEFLGID